MNHKWDKSNECVNCKVYREKQIVITLMAINNGKDINKYEAKYKYFSIDGESFTRPNCFVRTYDD